MVDSLGKVEEVTERLNNIYTIVGDIILSMVRVARYGSTKCYTKKIS